MNVRMFIKSFVYVFSCFFLSNVYATEVSLQWSSSSGAGTTGSNFITAAPGDQLTLDVIVNADLAGISSYGLSLQFDRSFGNELDIISTKELTPSLFAFSFSSGVQDSIDSNDSVIGEILTYEAATFGEGPASQSFLIGQAIFLVTNNISTDGSNVFSGLFNTGIDGIFDNLGNDIGHSIIFGEAGVNAISAVVPVPAGFILYLSGLTFLGLSKGSKK